MGISLSAIPGPGRVTPTEGATAYLLVAYNANYLWGPPGHISRADSGQFVTTLNRHLDLMEGLGQRADYFFTGLAAEKLAEWSPQTVTRLLNSAHGLNYHGANRPPYPSLVDLVQGESWEEDVALVRTYEAEGCHPTTGEHVGGMAAWQVVFGQNPFSTGRFFQASILAVNKELGARMGVGLEGNTGASRNDAWFLGVLNRPVSLALGPSPLVDAALNGRIEEYLAHVRAQLSGLNGPMPVAALLVHDHDFFKHPPDDREKIWALYEEALLLARNLGLQFVTMHDLYTAVQNGPGPAISRDALEEICYTLSQTMGTNGYPPEYVTADSIPYSLTESFEALAGALSVFRQTGSLPDSLCTHDLLGPTTHYTGSVSPGTLSAVDVLEAAAEVSDLLSDRLPSSVAVGGQTVNPAEFLDLMAQEYVALTEGGPAPVALRSVDLLPQAVTENDRADLLTKLQFWTYKPAIFAALGLKGDVNGDGEIDVLDVVFTVDIILGLYEPDKREFWAADFDGDGEVNVLDVVLIVNHIIGG
ncbi:MAG: dockerin type I repeat-containing protein [bacterium]